jgi:hypothetical protein
MSFPENTLVPFFIGIPFDTILPYLLVILLVVPLLFAVLPLILSDRWLSLRVVLSILGIAGFFGGFIVIGSLDNQLHDCKMVFAAETYSIDNKIFNDQHPKFVCRVRPIGSMEWSDWGA